MDWSLMRRRATVVALAVVLAAVALAPAAEAGHGRRVRYQGVESYRGGHRVVRVVHEGPFFIHRHSDAGSAIAGFLGGLVLGAVLSNAQAAAPPPPAYYYYDPWCRERFVTLDDYRDHFCCEHHPRVIEVRDARTDRCVDEYDWSDGAWHSERDEGRGPEVDPNWEE